MSYHFTFISSLGLFSVCCVYSANSLPAYYSLAMKIFDPAKSMPIFRMEPSISLPPDFESGELITALSRQVQELYLVYDISHNTDDL